MGLVSAVLVRNCDLFCSAKHEFDRLMLIIWFHGNTMKYFRFVNFSANFEQLLSIVMLVWPKLRHIIIQHSPVQTFLINTIHYADLISTDSTNSMSN